MCCLLGIRGKEQYAGIDGLGMMGASLEGNETQGTKTGEWLYGVLDALNVSICDY